MAFKHPKNPKVIELTKSYTGRSYAVGRLPYIMRDDGSKGCIWCGDPLKSTHHMTRYCNDENCMKSIYAWSNPQKDEGRQLLLERQDFKCNICAFDWKPYFPNNRPNWRCPADRAPEVDHIVPIYKGGQALGFDNHQCICYTCHKAKSKIDNSGPRSKKK